MLVHPVSNARGTLRAMLQPNLIYTHGPFRSH